MPSQPIDIHIDFGSRTTKAIVYRCERAGMAAPCLSKVIVPTLLIVGGRDEEVAELDRYGLKGIGYINEGIGRGSGRDTLVRRIRRI